MATDYASLSREQLERRLRVAEDVCLMFGWTGGNGDTDRAKAALEVWMRWADLVGADYTGPEAHPELAAAETSLARQRDAKRAATLAHFFGPEEG